ncbi:MAG: hypothetical protein M0T72_10220 [Candidatus Dormibacteraeota bacterium]|nr:hypothetical protein [Candidatus Dormibacteraeota bacterium]
MKGVTLTTRSGPRPAVHREQDRGGYLVVGLFGFAAGSAAVYLLSSKASSSSTPPPA